MWSLKQWNPDVLVWEDCQDIWKVQYNTGHWEYYDLFFVCEKWKKNIYVNTGDLTASGQGLKYLIWRKHLF